MSPAGSLSCVCLKKCLLLLILCCWLIPAAQSAAAGSMLPRVDDGEADVAGWWMSEKLDGVRGYWDGQRLWSKNGQLFQPPVAFVAGLPGFPLEGELWGGRGTFEQTASVVQRAQPHDGWRQLQFAIFDVPAAGGPFSERIALAQEWFAAHPSDFAFVIPQLPVAGRAQLQQELQRIEALGGEGLIVRNPQALYRAGRSPEILKVKGFDDAEAVVVGHVPGRGANLGRLGSLLVELADGTRFKIGTGFSAAQRETPPPIGCVVTYKYYGFYQSGIPKFPSFLRIRYDQGL
ncbi:DNA ligase [Trichloromonas sp.]|uniref:DNA ligase n=1 Tax=Trichloromonas sp. TaxID=3069249 RepID=UPI003D814923